MSLRSLIAVLSLLVGGVAHAQSVTVEEIACLPGEANHAVRASVEQMVAGGSVRLYFRRLNPLGAFYYTTMRPTAADAYWSVFPKPETRRQAQLTDEWWEVLQTRDWIVREGRDRQWLESWLDEGEQEAAEYYAAIHDARGEFVERSDTRLVRVADRDDCEARLSAREEGWARNLTVGETTELQLDKPLFHWLCDGVVTRVSASGILRPDAYCRACVVAAAEPARPATPARRTVAP
jgi:hypothetical protein